MAGTVLGEALFRMSSLVLERGDTPKFWREIAAALSLATGFNRLVLGERYTPIFSSRAASYFSRLQVGLSATTRSVKSNSTASKHNELLADFSIEYGLPGKPGYEYTRPFDHFSFQSTASTANVFESIQARGLLVGRAIPDAEVYRGVGGLFGSYDHIRPQSCRISSTALALGTTAQRGLVQDIALQGTALLGAGYAAVGTLHGAAAGEYHYGVAPQALLALRLILGTKAMLDVTAGEYVVSGVSSSGHDNVVRADVALTNRVHKQHTIVVKYL